MTNSNLIPVFTGSVQDQQIQLCNARELHHFLESKQQYSHWIKDRITDYGFVENEDYIIVTERTAGRPRKEYHITLDMGKELGMVERNDKGRQIRKYFIAVEKQQKQNSQPTLPLVETQQDEEALHIIVNLFHSLNGAYDMSEKIRNNAPHIEKSIHKELGGYHLYNLNEPTRQALEKARKYIHAKSERIMFVKGMLSLLEEPKRIAN